MATFDERVRVVLAQRGVTFDERGRFALAASFSGPDQPSQAVVDYLNERSAGSNVRTGVQFDWSADFVHTIDRIVAGNSTDGHALRVVFFLRLYGLVVDFRKNYQLFRTSLRSPSSPGSDLWHLTNVLDALESMRAELTEDEQLYAEYRRHVDAHVLQGAYDLQWNRPKDVAKERFTSKYTGVEYDVRDLNGRLDAVIRRYQGEPAIAADFARRLRPHSVAVLSAMKGFCGDP